MDRGNLSEARLCIAVTQEEECSSSNLRRGEPSLADFKFPKSLLERQCQSTILTFIFPPFGRHYNVLHLCYTRFIMGLSPVVLASQRKTISRRLHGTVAVWPK